MSRILQPVKPGTHLSPAAKATPVKRVSARPRRSAIANEDDAEQALKEIVATLGKADRATEDSAGVGDENAPPRADTDTMSQISATSNRKGSDG